MESDEMIPIDIKCEGKDIDLEDELDEVAELPPPKKILPTKDEEKPTCKCKKCGKEYIVTEAYGTRNLKRHLELCPRKFEAPLSIPVSTVADIGLLKQGISQIISNVVADRGAKE
ncbi:hypothetical protein SO802_026514 [Lithocarpus litseifolius]|uniref:BED-type domain-containing protein n=1 Tax=Lithocarpus litseifolius TaxID=425828 RepID=A0AAW2C339_9ROSI